MPAKQIKHAQTGVFYLFGGSKIHPCYRTHKTCPPGHVLCARRVSPPLQDTTPCPTHRTDKTRPRRARFIRSARLKSIPCRRTRKTRPSGCVYLFSASPTPTPDAPPVVSSLSPPLPLTISSNPSPSPPFFLFIYFFLCILNKNVF